MVNIAGKYQHVTELKDYLRSYLQKSKVNCIASCFHSHCTAGHFQCVVQILLLVLEGMVSFGLSIALIFFFCFMP